MIGRQGSKMKSSKKAEKIHIKNATSTLHSSPTYSSPQPVKLKYGMGNAPRNADAPLSAPSNKKPSSSTTGVGNAKPKSKPVSNETKGISKASSGQSSSTSFTNQRPLPKQGDCEICRQPCRSHCAGCKRVFYCSKQHQQSDWPKHKLICRPFSIPAQYSSGFHLRPPGVLGSSSTLLSSSSNRSGSSPGSLSPELLYMICTKSIPAGTSLFSEKPILVIPNILVTPSNEKYRMWCCCCLKTIPNPTDSLNNNTPNSRTPSGFCRKCEIPLCIECYDGLGYDSKCDAAFSNKFYGGQGHSCEECAIICELRQKSPECVMNLKTTSSVNDERYAAHFMKDISLLRVLMFRTSCPWRWESLIALRNSPRYTACCKHNLGNLEGWLGAGSSPDYPVASYYLKNICKEKNIALTDIVKILAVFCEMSIHSPGLLVLYENLSWLAHACSANTEHFFRSTSLSPVEVDSHQSNLEIVVKTVRTIDEGSKITTNYIRNYEGGRSALALKLFQTTGHYCCDTDCECYNQHNWDKTMGIRCDLIFSSKACSGILSPRVDAPNADKLNLGMGMFFKSKKWECDRCKKFEKYENLHTKIVEIARDLTSACDRCCNSSSSAGSGGFGNKSQQSSFLQLQNKLLSNLSDQHWMVWKAKLRVLKSWTATVGYGSAMLRAAMSQPSTTCTKDGLIYVLKQKVDIYGEGIYGGDIKQKHKMGILELLAKRHGPASPKRGHRLFDAFFANLIILLEDYKKELPITPGQTKLQRAQIAQEYCKKVGILRRLLEQTVESLKLTEGTTLSHTAAKSLKMAKELLEIFNKVCRRTEQRSYLIIGYLNDFMELFTCQDPSFDQSLIQKSQLKHDPFMESLIGDDAIEFEIDSVNVGPIPWFTFGSTSASGSPSASFSKTSSSTRFSYGSSSAAESGFEFSSFGDNPSFGVSDNDSISDDDDASNNPFIYSRASRRNKTNDTNHRTRGCTESTNKGKAQNKSKPKPQKSATDEDWSSYFWFSSDDENDNLFDDDEFDLGFTSSPRSTFGSDLFNDRELDELAEWATLQFIMGKMSL